MSPTLLTKDLVNRLAGQLNRSVLDEAHISSIVAIMMQRQPLRWAGHDVDDQQAHRINVVSQ